MLAVSLVVSFLMLYLGALVINKFDHLLSVFITFEFFVLLLFMNMVFFFNFFFFFLTLFFLVVSASESVLGLTLFVYFVRSFMKDYVYGLGVLTF